MVYILLKLRLSTQLLTFVLTLYNGLWSLALPILKRSKKISNGWRQRTVQDVPTGSFDIWIQSASGGESLLANMILEQLSYILPGDTVHRILVTSGSKQGVDTLNLGKKCHQKEMFELVVSYFPFDAPTFMKKAFASFTPRMIVVVETELWPSFLVEAHNHNVPVLLVNGRMSAKSFRSYRYLHRFFNTYGPERVWAISETDRDRFRAVCGDRRVELMDNIKFDRMEPQTSGLREHPLKKFLPIEKKVVLLGSVRKEEEGVLCTVVEQLRRERPDVVVCVCPKHIERASVWLELLSQKKISAIKRSDVNGQLGCDSVVVWDTFGELAQSYGLADTAFVGGSLVDLGGQNFLEPLAFGVRPVIGPYWSDFAWVGRNVIEKELVVEVATGEELLAALLAELDYGVSKKEIIARSQHYFAAHKGGSKAICKQIVSRLKKENEPC